MGAIFLVYYSVLGLDPRVGDAGYWSFLRAYWRRAGNVSPSRRDIYQDRRDDGKWLDDVEIELR
jgi:hypothetical protein